MGKREYNAARQEANARYDEKTYKKYLFRLRLEDDADIIRSIEEAQANGKNKREWLKDSFEAGLSPEDMATIRIASEDAGLTTTEYIKQAISEKMARDLVK